MGYLAKRILILIATLLLVTILAFLAFQVIPGDPVLSMLGTEYTPGAGGGPCGMSWG